MERTNRRSFTGVVVSDKNDKTIVVKVSTPKAHPKYGKRVTISKKFYAHDENNEAKLNDTVTIMETRPMSATKRFRLIKIVARGVEKVELKDELAKEEAK
jgi:small subunit ribosomal protein S17